MNHCHSANSSYAWPRYCQFQPRCITHSSAPLIIICPLLPGLLVESLFDLELSTGIGLSIVILRCFTYTHTQTQTLAGACCIALYMPTIGPQLGAHTPIENMIACVCCTYIISIPKREQHTYIHTYNHTDSKRDTARD